METCPQCCSATSDWMELPPSPPRRLVNRRACHAYARQRQHRRRLRAGDSHHDPHGRSCGCPFHVQAVLTENQVLHLRYFCEKPRTAVDIVLHRRWRRVASVTVNLLFHIHLMRLGFEGVDTAEVIMDGDEEGHLEDRCICGLIGVFIAFSATAVAELHQLLGAGDSGHRRGLESLSGVLGRKGLAGRRRHRWAVSLSRMTTMLVIRPVWALPASMFFCALGRHQGVGRGVRPCCGDISAVIPVPFEATSLSTLSSHLMREKCV